MATLGDTSIESSSDWWPDDSGMWVGPYTMPGNGTGTSMSLYVAGGAAGAATYRLAVYNDSSGVPGTLVTNGVTPEITVANGAAAAWVTGTFGTGPTLVSGNKYWLFIWFGKNMSSNGLFKYASTAGFSRIKSGGVTYSTTLNPPTYSSATTDVEKASLYITYTTGGGGTDPIVPAAITASSSMSGGVTRLAQVKPAAITSTSSMSGAATKQALIKPAAIIANSTMSSATVTALRPVRPSAITSTSTIAGAVTALKLVRPAAITATSSMTGVVSGGSTTTTVVSFIDQTPLFVATHH